MAGFCSERFQLRSLGFGSRLRILFWSDGTWEASRGSPGRQRGSSKGHQDTNWIEMGRFMNTRSTIWHSIFLSLLDRQQLCWIWLVHALRVRTLHSCGDLRRCTLLHGCSSIRQSGRLWTEKGMLISARDWLLVHDYALTLIGGQFLPANFSYV